MPSRFQQDTTDRDSWNGLTGSRVTDLVARQRDPMIDMLAQLVEIETPSSDASAAWAGLQRVGDALDHLDYEVSYGNGGSPAGWLVAQPHDIADTDPRQLLVGHVDTVWPLGTLESMPLKVGDQQIHGPGSYDMKGGLVQMIFALRVLSDLDVAPPLKPVVFVNSDEEIGSPGSTDTLAGLARRSARAFVLEPSLGLEGALKTSRKGATRYDVEIKGRSAHAGLDPAAGSNAIVILAEVVRRLFDLNEPERGVSVNVGLIEGGTRPNVIPESARAVVDVRTPTKAEANRIDERLQNIRIPAERGSISITRSGGRPPMEVTAESRALWQDAHRAAGVLGFHLEQAKAGGVSDGNTTSQYCPTLDGLGATGDGAHAAHEHVLIDRMLERTALLILLLITPSS